MTTQPEALRLADELNKSHLNHYLNHAAAAELRRLHEAHEWQYTMAGQRLRRIEKLEASNQELLAALKLARSIIGHPDDAHTRMISDAINKAERTTT